MEAHTGDLENSLSCGCSGLRASAVAKSLECEGLRKSELGTRLGVLAGVQQSSTANT